MNINSPRCPDVLVRLTIHLLHYVSRHSDNFDIIVYVVFGLIEKLWERVQRPWFETFSKIATQASLIYFGEIRINVLTSAKADPVEEILALSSPIPDILRLGIRIRKDLTITWNNGSNANALDSSITSSANVTMLSIDKTRMVMKINLLQSKFSSFQSWRTARHWPTVRRKVTVNESFLPFSPRSSLRESSKVTRSFAWPWAVGNVTDSARAPINNPITFFMISSGWSIAGNLIR